MTDKKPRRGPKGGRERFQLVIPAEVLAKAKQLADAENRSISNMLATLVSEAIKTREESEKGQPAAELLAA